VLASSDLHDGCEEGHGVEEARDPKRRWSYHVAGPLLELSNSQQQVSIPLSQRLL